ncbi:MAG: bifunctional nicotinamidase/pyrazinamidase [Elusimicrobiaceae bacterium]|jgi:nicotinamidase/pyrazinamidase
MKKALLIVDLQNDFCPGGALGVHGGDEIVPVINRLITRAAARGYLIAATRDWHPEKTTHFNSFGGLWPAHCVMDSHGAKFHPEAALPPQTIIVSKGTNHSDNAYSAFEGRTETGLALSDVLRENGITELYITGLATDYCVKESALGAIRHGFACFVVKDACRAVNIKPDDEKNALEEMEKHGVRIILAGDLNGE